MSIGKYVLQYLKENAEKENDEIEAKKASEEDGEVKEEATIYKTVSQIENDPSFKMLIKDGDKKAFIAKHKDLTGLEKQDVIFVKEVGGKVVSVYGTKFPIVDSNPLTSILALEEGEDEDMEDREEAKEEDSEDEEDVEEGKSCEDDSEEEEESYEEAKEEDSEDEESYEEALDNLKKKYGKDVEESSDEDEDDTEDQEEAKEEDSEDEMDEENEAELEALKKKYGDKFQPYVDESEDDEDSEEQEEAKEEDSEDEEDDMEEAKEDSDEEESEEDPEEKDEEVMSFRDWKKKQKGSPKEEATEEDSEDEVKKPLKESIKYKKVTNKDVLKGVSQMGSKMKGVKENPVAKAPTKGAFKDSPKAAKVSLKDALNGNPKQADKKMKGVKENPVAKAPKTFKK